MGIEETKSWASLVSFKQLRKATVVPGFSLFILILNPSVLLSLCSILVLRGAFIFQAGHPSPRK